MTRDGLFTPRATPKPSKQLDGRAQRIVAGLPPGNERSGLIEYFAGRPLAVSSIRSYQSVADRCVSLLAARGKLSAESVAPFCAELRAIIAQAPLPDVPRTSAAKMCLAPAWQIETVIHRLERNAGAGRDPLMGELTWRWAAVLWALACRPSEPLDMEMAPGDLLVLPNRKEDDVRCDGPLRVLRLGACDQDLLAHVRRLVVIIATMRAAGRADDEVLRAMAERLAAVSTEAGFGRMCAYTLRHSAIARWREEGVEEEEIRRRLGHAGDAARRHYSKPRRGLRIAGRKVEIAAGDAHDLATACAALGIVIEDTRDGGDDLRSEPAGGDHPAGEAEESGVMARSRGQERKTATCLTSRPLSPPPPSTGDAERAPIVADAAAISVAMPPAVAPRPAVAKGRHGSRRMTGKPETAASRVRSVTMSAQRHCTRARAAPWASAATQQQRVPGRGGRADDRGARCVVPGGIPSFGARGRLTAPWIPPEAGASPGSADEAFAPFREPAVQQGAAPRPSSTHPTRVRLRRVDYDEAWFRLPVAPTRTTDVRRRIQYFLMVMTRRTNARPRRFGHELSPRSCLRSENRPVIETPAGGSGGFTAGIRMACAVAHLSPPRSLSRSFAFLPSSDHKLSTC